MATEAPRQVVIASGNAGKLAELGALFSGWPWQLVPQSRFALPAAAESGDSFAANALQKARAASRRSGLPAIADDSGLEVDALGGAPGIFSARYAGEHASDGDNNRKLLRALAGVPPERRGARFCCALVYLRHWRDADPIICQASWEGRILEAPRGRGGFGYDPLFFATEQGRGAAELAPEAKNRFSHRGQAMRLLLRALRREYR